MGNIEKYKKTVFEKIKKTNEFNSEFWSARELAEILEYRRWDKFLNVIDKAKKSCRNSMIEVEDHFSHLGRMVNIGSGAERKIDDILLSRYACYLIVQNADSRKEIVSLGQTYFAIQTRKQELQEEYEQLTEEKLRREEIKGKKKANQTHYKVGAKVRQTIKELGGTMPENLPTPDKSIKQLEKDQKELEE